MAASRHLYDLNDPLNYDPFKIPPTSKTNSYIVLEIVQRQIASYTENLIKTLKDLKELQRQQECQNLLFRRNIFSVEPNSSRITSRRFYNLNDPLNYHPSKVTPSSQTTNTLYLENLKRQISSHSQNLIDSLEDLKNLQIQDRYELQPQERQNLLPRHNVLFAKRDAFREVDPNKFVLGVNVAFFKASDIDVKVEDGFVIVTAKHEDHTDEYGVISRSFTRRYKLPEDVDSDKVTSSLFQHGYLTIKAPRKLAVPAAFEGGRIIYTPEVVQQQTLEKGLRQSIPKSNLVPQGTSDN